MSNRTIHLWWVGAALCLAPEAHAAEGPWSGSLTASTSFLSGPVAAWNPALSGSLGGTLGRTLGDWSGAASWSLSRDVHVCDTCGDDYDPGNGGSGSSRLVETSDLALSAARSWEVLGTRITASLPASRDSLTCNPLYGALGAAGSAGWQLGGVGLSGELAVARSFYAHPAAPVGRSGCSEPLVDYAGTETLVGLVEPDGYEGTVYAAGGANADWSGRATLAVTDLHSLLGDPERLTTSASLGLASRHTRVAESHTLQTLSGDLVVAASDKPFVWSWPVSVAAGWRWSERLSSSLTLANQVPRDLYDTAGFYRSAPANTSLSLSLTGSL